MLSLKVLSFKSLVPWGRLSVRDRRGFSMVELLVVAAVIGILALIVIPWWITYVPAATLNGAARQVQSGLNQARLLAISTRQNIRVQVVPGGYQFQQGNSVPLPWQPWTGLDTDGTGTFRPFTSNNIALAGPSAVFTPFGTANPGAVLTVTGPQGRTITVRVLPSGQVTSP